jgi:hypothetical protein
VILFFAFIIWTLRSALYEPVVEVHSVPAEVKFNVAKEIPQNPSKTSNTTGSSNNGLMKAAEPEPDQILEIGAIV